MFKGINAKLLGASMDHLPEEALVFNELMMYDFNMGYYTPNKQTPFSSVGYFKEENEFIHPWSIESSGKQYGYHKLHEIIPLKDFMEMPAFIVDELVEAVTQGKIARDKEDAAEAKRREEERNRADKTRDLDDVAKELGIK